MTFVIINNGDFKVVVSLSGDDYILDIEMRIVGGLNIADGNEESINWHMKVVIF
jgi:hypothetical protein